MKDFFKLDLIYQCQILAELLQRISKAAWAENDVRSIDTLAARDGRSIEALWVDVCQSQGVELVTIPSRLFGPRD